MTIDKRTKVEGSPEAQFVQLIRKFGGATKHVDFETATVTSPPPNLSIRLNVGGLELMADDLVVAGHLTEHERETDAGPVLFKNALKAGDTVIVACMDKKMQYIVIDKAVTY